MKERHDTELVSQDQNSLLKTIISPFTLIYQKFINTMVNLHNKYPRAMGRFYFFCLPLLQLVINFNMKTLEDISIIELSYIKAIITTILAWLVMNKFDIEILPKNDLGKETCMYVLTIGSMAHLCFYISTELVDISRVSVFISSASLWTPIVGILILKQNVTLLQIFCVIGSFFGIILVVDPAIIGLTLIKDFGEEN